MRLQQCLHETNTSHLRAISAYRKINTGENPTQAQLISVLKKELTQESKCKALIEMMNGSESEIVQQIRDAGGSHNAAELEKSWGCDDPDVAKRWFWHEKVSSGLARLRLAGILFLVYKETESEKHYVLPEEFHDWFSLPPLIEKTKGYAPYTYFAAELNLLSDIFHVLQYFEQFRVRVLRNGNLPKRHKNILIKRLNELAPSEHPRDLHYIEFIFELLTAAEFLNLRRGILIVSVSMKTWFARTPAEQIQDIFRIWMSSDKQFDIEAICGNTIESAGLRHPVKRVKLAFIELVKRLPRRWIKLSDISEYFYRYRPFFFRTDHSEGLWRLTDRDTGELISGDKTWDCLEIRILNFLIGNILVWMGLIALGIDKNSKADGCYLTPLGNLVLCGDSNSVEHEIEPPLNKLIIQADFEILAPAAIVLSVRDYLEKVAEFVCGGYIQRYRLTRDSIAKAMESGLEAGEIMNFLEKASEGNLPGNIRASLSDWMDEFGQIDFSKRILLSTRDEYLMLEIMSRPAISKFIEKQIGPSAALIRELDADSLVSEIKRAGYLPRVTINKKTNANLASISLNLDSSSADFLALALKEWMKNSEYALSNKEEFLANKLIEQLNIILEQDKLEP